MKRANIGCGSIQPDGWDNYDVRSADPPLVWDIREPAPDLAGRYDYAVCSFMLQELDFHELPDAIVNIAGVLKPGGGLRVLVPDVLRAVTVYMQGDEGWFPQDERTGGLDAKFCTYVTWFGTVRSVFTQTYLWNLLEGNGFRQARQVDVGRSWFTDDGIAELDSRPKEALIFEARK